MTVFLNVDNVRRCLSLLLPSSVVYRYINLILLLIKHLKCSCFSLLLWQDGRLSDFRCPVELCMLKNSTQINFCWQNTCLNIIILFILGKLIFPVNEYFNQNVVSLLITLRGEKKNNLKNCRHFAWWLPFRLIIISGILKQRTHLLNCYPLIWKMSFL